MSTSIKFENISKQYRLGLVSTKTISHDLNRWWKTNVLGKEDPYLKIGEVNDRAHKGNSEYVWALKDINFEVEQGDVLGIIGKNGAGKSTLLKILSKVTAPTTGTIKAAGRIASLLEVGTGFHPEMTGRENIYMNGAIMGMSKIEITRKLEEIVDFSGVERYLDTPVKRYSSGMTVRLGFAIAAHLEPEILVVDEVLAVGDAEFQKKAIGKMQDVSRGEGRTVLFVSHNMASMKMLCNKGILLSDGIISNSGNIHDVISDYLISGIEFTKNNILSNVKYYSNQINIFELTVNGKKQNFIELNFPERKFTINIHGNIKDKLKINIECLIYDKNDNLLMKFAPGLNSSSDYFNAGEFEISKDIILPHNITNGEYYMQIDIVNPKIEYYLVISKALIIYTKNFNTELGVSLNFENFGLLYLDM